jgi:hypothetical protein
VRAGINGRKVSGREIRRHFKAHADTMDESVLPALQVLVHNEAVTQIKIAALEEWRARGFWGRFLWLARGH